VEPSSATGGVARPGRPLRPPLAGDGATGGSGGGLAELGEEQRRLLDGEVEMARSQRPFAAVDAGGGLPGRNGGLRGDGELGRHCETTKASKGGPVELERGLLPTPTRERPAGRCMRALRAAAASDGAWPDGPATGPQIGAWARCSGPGVGRSVHGGAGPPRSLRGAVHRRPRGGLALWSAGRRRSAPLLIHLPVFEIAKLQKSSTK
jgi:hypothetical protein